MADRLKRELSNRHIQLIAIGGAIGTGLFLGAGQSISLAGPSILLTYIIVGFALFMFMRAMGEMLLSDTKFNSFADITNEYVGPLAGFITGWTYWLTWIISGMAEVTAVAKYVSFWYPEIPNWLSALACILLLMSFNLLSTRLFGELEFWFAIIKVVTIVALIIIGIVMIVMAYQTPFGHASFSNIYNNGGVFPNGMSGFLMSFQMAIFSFLGIEMIGITAGETKNPHKTIPQAINNVPFRILIFYIGALAVIISIIPWNQLDPDNSPFVKVFALVGIPFAAGIINFVVLTAAASACNSGIFANSRTLFGLADRKQAPPKFQVTNRRGVPVTAILVTCTLLLFAVLLNYFIPNATTVFVYISTVSTVLNIFIWTLIMIAYYRYTRVRPDLHKGSKFKMPGGKIMALCIIIFFAFIFCVLFVNPETRIGVIFAPLWLVVLAIMYRQYKKHAV
ncbi:amino acid permease [Staphylococcus xylosus]|uniref:amino acid permease n=1 Tax=Staphylococcus xylosus TaxID=1288 RepID=UPI000853C619|nr:amino acid permease [Staphylococcus xylosus]MBG3875073.1 amino acid permease [Staphylococcus xylosus]MBM6639108.1 amino acid permease [Staphylococcus xylosus]MDW8554773.1 amino acid permease [Staphylococcus xylosus]OEK81977.1 gamma-aminobutyrate permease [Staphylococcus xylosus]OEK88888.1 gamma-aminobutyrate permease [Staphylococcus xylosus]